MKSKNRIISLLILTVIAALVLFYFQSKTCYHPVSVSVELRSDTADVCQLFYDNGKSYTEEESMKLFYKFSPAFQRVIFKLPAEAIHGLRIDPGYKSEKFYIKSITIQSGTYKHISAGAEILNDYNLTNLVPNDSLQKGFLTLLSVNSKDVQLELTKSLVIKLNSVDPQAKRFRLAITFAIYLVLVLLVAFLGRKLVERIKTKFSAFNRYLYDALLSVDRKYLIAILILFGIKAMLISVQQMTAFTYARHDDALFIRLAYSIVSGDWLGPYDQLTLVRGFFYPFFIAGTYFSGIPLLFAQYLVLCAAVVAVVYSLSPVLENRFLKILLIAILLFNPMNSSNYSLRIIRDGLYVSLSLLVVAAFIGLYLRRKQKNEILLAWAVFASLVLFAFWNTREEGWLIIPALALLTLMSLASVFNKPQTVSLFIKIKDGIRYRWKTVLILLFPYLFLGFGNATLATINYIKYGSFVLNEMKSDAFNDAFGALSQIEQKGYEPKVPVSKDAREKAYVVSPTFAALKNDLEDRNNLFLQYGEGTPGDFKGGWFMFAFREAAEKAGYHNSLPESQAFYRRVSEEINNAFQAGKLNKTSTLTVFQFKLDEKIIKPIIVKLYEVLRFVVKYEGYNPVGEATSPDLIELADFQKITGEPAKLDVQQNAETSITKGKYTILNKIRSLYAISGPYLLALALIAYVLLTLRCISKRRSKRTTAFWLILTTMAMIWVSRIALIAYISTTQWDAMNVHYLCPTYPYLLIFEFLAIYSLVDLVKKEENLNSHT